MGGQSNKKGGQNRILPTYTVFYDLFYAFLSTNPSSPV